MYHTGTFRRQVDLAYTVGTSAFDNTALSGARNLLAAITRRMDVNRNTVRVALQSYESQSRTAFDFDDFGSQNQVIGGIQSRLSFGTGTLNTRVGLSSLRALYASNRGDRANVPNVAILFVRGSALANELRSGSRVTEIEREVQQLRQRPICLIVIADQDAAGSNIRRLQPDWWFVGSSFNQLADNSATIDNIVGAIDDCAGPVTPGNYARPCCLPPVGRNCPLTLSLSPGSCTVFQLSLLCCMIQP